MKFHKRSLESRNGKTEKTRESFLQVLRSSRTRKRFGCRDRNDSAVEIATIPPLGERPLVQHRYSPSDRQKRTYQRLSFSRSPRPRRRHDPSNHVNKLPLTFRYLSQRFHHVAADIVRCYLGNRARIGSTRRLP
jgi:hypothetical protein